MLHFIICLALDFKINLFYKDTVKLLIEPHGALLEGVNDCSFKNRV